MLLAGGGLAYVRAGSTASLAGASFAAAGYGLGAVQMNRGRVGEGHAIAGVVGLGLAVGMGMRFARSGRFFPPGALAALGGASAAYELNKAWEWLG